MGETILRLVLILRSVVFMVLMAVATIIWSFACLLSAPFPYAQRYWWTSRWNVFVIWTARVICGIRYEMRGTENLPDAPVILLSKHQSAWETIFYVINMPRPLVFVFKKELTYIPFFGWGIGLLRMIPIDRKKGRDAFAQVLEHGRRRLRETLILLQPVQFGLQRIELLLVCAETGGGVVDAGSKPADLFVHGMKCEQILNERHAQLNSTKETLITHSRGMRGPCGEESAWIRRLSSSA